MNESKKVGILQTELQKMGLSHCFGDGYNKNISRLERSLLQPELSIQLTLIALQYQARQNRQINGIGCAVSFE